MNIQCSRYQRDDLIGLITDLKGSLLLIIKVSTYGDRFHGEVIGISEEIFVNENATFVFS
jgi:hypothetical protein